MWGLCYHSEKKKHVLFSFCDGVYLFIFRPQYFMLNFSIKSFILKIKHIAICLVARSSIMLT